MQIHLPLILKRPSHAQLLALVAFFPPFLLPSLNLKSKTVAAKSQSRELRFCHDVVMMVMQQRLSSALLLLSFVVRRDSLVCLREAVPWDAPSAGAGCNYKVVGRAIQ
ncbi:hypothetical protein F5X68DRAFT_635 [Plectosphaerella plurivora]|uniref:Uncharacterized protein n=1 Tax=Plectosphaerella plurivora TaxID=936078 RepID=A0A9P9AG58_9PEZI|nr:hypothetical protein F5X68DRAFT_635 [Plectosphaerella plurivora]